MQYLNINFILSKYIELKFNDFHSNPYTITTFIKVFIKLNFLIMELEWLALIIPAGYYLISTIFLLFPNILHKRMKYSYEPFNNLVESNKVFCIGHRGGAW